MRTPRHNAQERTIFVSLESSDDLEVKASTTNDALNALDAIDLLDLVL